MGLVITRREGEKVWIGDNIVIQVEHVGLRQVKLLFTAPEEIKIRRYQKTIEIEVDEKFKDAIERGENVHEKK